MAVELDPTQAMAIKTRLEKKISGICDPVTNPLGIPLAFDMFTRYGQKDGQAPASPIRKEIANANSVVDSADRMLVDEASGQQSDNGNMVGNVTAADLAIPEITAAELTASMEDVMIAHETVHMDVVMQENQSPSNHDAESDIQSIKSGENLLQESALEVHSDIFSDKVAENVKRRAIFSSPQAENKMEPPHDNIVE